MSIPSIRKRVLYWGLSCLLFCLSVDIKRIRGARGVYLLWGWGNTFPFEGSLLHFLRRLIRRNLGIQLDTGFMPEISAPGFYKRNFPLPWKAFRDARQKPTTRELVMKVGQIVDF